MSSDAAIKLRVSSEQSDCCENRPSPFFAYIDLGYLFLKRVPENPEICRVIEEQIGRISSEPFDRIPELRDPFLE